MSDDAKAITVVVFVVVLLMSLFTVNGCNTQRFTDAARAALHQSAIEDWEPGLYEYESGEDLFGNPIHVRLVVDQYLNQAHATSDSWFGAARTKTDFKKRKIARKLIRETAKEWVKGQVEGIEEIME